MKGDVKKKMPRLQEKEISMKRHAERNGCQERDMPRATRNLKKKTCQGKERHQEKDAKTSRERDFNEKACREKRMSGKRHAERIRDLKKKTCQGKEKRQEKGAKISRERDFMEKACREKRMSGKTRAERKRNLKKKTCQWTENEREMSRKRCQDFKRKRFQ